LSVLFPALAISPNGIVSLSVFNVKLWV